MSEIRLSLPDGNERRLPAGITGQGIAEKIGPRLAKDALAIKLDGRLQDLNLPVEQDASIAILTFDSPEGREVYWHSTSHLMAHAVKQLFPQAKLAIGPAIEEGFYYDFDLERPFTPEDLVTIEKKMAELAKAATPITRKNISKADALAFFNNRGEAYKAELISELPDEPISIYEQDDFADLCRGPHVSSTAKIKAFKLLSIAGAYWRGSEKNKMLQRIYGISFPAKEKLTSISPGLRRSNDATTGSSARTLTSSPYPRSREADWSCGIPAARSSGRRSRTSGAMSTRRTGMISCSRRTWAGRAFGKPRAIWTFTARTCIRPWTWKGRSIS